MHVYILWRSVHFVFFLQNDAQKNLCLLSCSFFEYISFSIWNMDWFFWMWKLYVGHRWNKWEHLFLGRFSSFQFVFLLDIVLPACWSRVQQWSKVYMPSLKFVVHSYVHAMVMIGQKIPFINLVSVFYCLANCLICVNNDYHTMMPIALKLVWLILSWTRNKVVQ